MWRETCPHTHAACVEFPAGLASGAASPNPASYSTLRFVARTSASAATATQSVSSAWPAWEASSQVEAPRRRQQRRLLLRVGLPIDTGGEGTLMHTRVFHSHLAVQNKPASGENDVSPTATCATSRSPTASSSSGGVLPPCRHRRAVLKLQPGSKLER